jgi:O-antigen ligase
MTSPRFVAGSFWAVSGSLLVTGGVVGSVASVLAVLLSLLLVPLALPATSRLAMLRQPAMVAFLLVLAALTASYTITADEPGDVLFAANFISLLLAPLVYLAARELRGPQLIGRIATLALVGSGVAATYALFQVLVMHAERAFALFAGGNLMPRVALICGFVALVGWFVTTGRRRFIYLAGPVLGILAAFLSGSRGSLLAVPFALVIAGVFVLTDPRTRDPWRILLLAVAAGVAGTAAAIALAGIAAVDLNAFAERVRQIATTMIELVRGGSTSDIASMQRLDMLNAAYGAFLDAPWLGHGWGNFQAAALPYNTLTINYLMTSHFMFHNDIANFAVAAGVVGLLCWLVLLVSPAVGLAAVPRDAYGRVRLYSIVLLIVVYAVFGLTDMTLGYDYTTVLYAFLCAIALGGMREAGGDEPARSAPPTPAVAASRQ